MKKILLYFVCAIFLTQMVMAEGTAFDSNEKAIEVRLAPAINSTPKPQPQAQQNVNTMYKPTIKEEKFNNALINLDDAQVELRQEYAAISAKYTTALEDKKRAIQNCKMIKKEMKNINKKMKNVEKSKKIINKNLEVQS